MVALVVEETERLMAHTLEGLQALQGKETQEEMGTETTQRWWRWKKAWPGASAPNTQVMQETVVSENDYRTGSNINYAGGGGGGRVEWLSRCQDGGNGSYANNSLPPTAGAVNTGGGGGGSGSQGNNTSYSAQTTGSSGIVVISTYYRRFRIYVTFRKSFKCRHIVIVAEQDYINTMIDNSAGEWIQNFTIPRRYSL